jgi:ATPase subunit of ABC transporter with duplicated ATPase domains
VSQVIELKNGHLDEYSGNYSYYLWKRDQESIAPKQKAEDTEPQDRGTSSRKTKEQKRQEAEAR